MPYPKNSLANFIAAKMDKRETKFVKNKKLEITVLSEFTNLFRESRYILCKQKIYNPLDENDKFFQYLRSERKRTYKDIEDDLQHIKYEAKQLLRAKKDLEICIDDLHHELDWYTNQEDMQTNYREMLFELKTQGIIDDHFNLKT